MMRPKRYQKHPQCMQIWGELINIPCCIWKRLLFLLVKNLQSIKWSTHTGIMSNSQHVQLFHDSNRNNGPGFLCDFPLYIEIKTIDRPNIDINHITQFSSHIKGGETRRKSSHIGQLLRQMFNFKARHNGSQTFEKLVCHKYLSSNLLFSGLPLI